jgi:uncharacterized protein (TIGR03435 family)
MKDFEQRVLERMPSPEEERAGLGRVWNQVERAGGQIPADVLRSVQQRLPVRHQRAWTFLPKAVAAVLVLGAAVGTAIVWPRGVHVYAAGNDGLQVTLADDSRVEMRAHAEMTVDRASGGIQIDLKTGDIIVTAATQRDGHLYVRTKDMTVALPAEAHRAKPNVAGTVFLVNVGEQGSRVGVIEGELRVREGNRETHLRPGEQVATSPTVAQRPLTEEITWSRNADAHLAILESFRRGIAQTTGALSPVAPASERQQGRGAVAPATVEFEEASIRGCDPDNLPPPPPGARGGGANSFQMTPGRLYALCMTPAVMIRIAHGFAAMPQGSLSADTRRGRGWRLNQVSGQGANSGIAVRGGPDWARNERYSIEAVAATESDADTMSGPMFRALLERRFKLKTHIEMEEVPAWSLTVAPGGLKIKPMASDGCYEPPEPQPGDPPLSPRSLEEVRSGAKPSCGVWAMEPIAGNAVLIVGGTTFAEFVDRLRVPLAFARVTDKTGVTDRFNFILEFTQDDQGSIVSAVERLGLRLDQSRASREFLVIDSIERPGPN